MIEVLHPIRALPPISYQRTMARPVRVGNARRWNRALCLLT